MLSTIIRYQAAIRANTPFIALNNKRFFLTSASVCNHNKDGEDNKKDNEKPPNGNSNETVKNNGDQQEKVEETAAKPSIEDELKDMTQKFKQLQSQYLLSLADQENLRQRMIREVNNAKEYSIQKFAKDILDSVDILNMALKSVPNEFHGKESSLKKEKEEIADQLVNLYTGVSMTKIELLKTLGRYDIVMDDPIDQIFDPNKHEAIFQAPVPEKKPGTIFVVQKVGYRMKDRTLRAAQVGVVAEIEK